MSVPDADTLIRLAEILEVSVSELLGTKIENENVASDVAEQLSRINEQLAIKNRRSRRIWKIVAIILAVIVLVNIFIAVFFSVPDLNSNTQNNPLWNAAEAVEKQWNSQLARRWVLTIPREIPPDQYAVLVREFCEQQFVSKGMIADFAIHDPHPPGHNPHAHIMLTMRAMDEHGKWLPKSRKVYDLDENGERIKLPSGRWKSHKEDTVDWNDQKYCEIWRHEWEVIQNRYLEANDRPERVDLRSYARQGLDIVPTVHEGAAVRQMEKRGIGILEMSKVFDSRQK